MSSDHPIVNNEITSKLRSEIRKKLDEIGRSSDDELPEYIMVMIANQRTKFQIKDDLSLFLGRDCISFVDWLLDRIEILKSEQENKLKNRTSSSKSSSSSSSAQQQPAQQSAQQQSSSSSLSTSNFPPSITATPTITANQQQTITSSSSNAGGSSGGGSGSSSATKNDKQNDMGVELILDEEMDLDLVGGEDKLNSLANSDEQEDASVEDDTIEDDNADTDGGKMQERCKYWPSCTTGDDCPYHHPTTPCRAFPNCRFGDKCLYIHPICKFDSSCTRRGCPFAHSGGARRMAPPHPFWAAPAPVTIAKCKFGLSCLNPKCQFIHPRAEPCRFGSNCLLDTCPFTHPNDELSKRPSQSAFKWTAQS